MTDRGPEPITRAARRLLGRSVQYSPDGETIAAALIVGTDRAGDPGRPVTLLILGPAITGHVVHGVPWSPTPSLRCWFWPEGPADGDLADEDLAPPPGPEPAPEPGAELIGREVVYFAFARDEDGRRYLRSWPARIVAAQSADLVRLEILDPKFTGGLVWAEKAATAAPNRWTEPTPPEESHRE
jgi:hypothetical protein